MSVPATSLIVLMPSGRRGQVPEGTTVLEAARLLGIQIESICGGLGTCHKCLVQIEEGYFAKHGIESRLEHTTPLTSVERRTLARLGLSSGRLACQARIQGDLLVNVPESSRGQKQIIRKSARVQQSIEIAPALRQRYLKLEPSVLGAASGDWERVRAAACAAWGLDQLSIDLPALRNLQAALRDGAGGLTLTCWQQREIIDVQPGYAEGLYGLAVDVGTTTIAAHLCDLRTGAILATESRMNPQVTYGEDIMSRIAYVNEEPGGLQRLHQGVISAINELALAAAAQAGITPTRIGDAVIVGNTTMMHLLLAVSPETLGAAPFTLTLRDAVDCKARDLGLTINPGAYIHVLPAEGGHVGADNVAVLLAENAGQIAEPCVIVDVGTNAEIVLHANGQLYSASSPTGPAFEGAQITHGMRAARGAIERVRIDPQTGLPNFRVIGDERWSQDWPPHEDGPRAAGICGSGIIEVVAEMYCAGLIGADGRLNLAHPSGRVQRTGDVVAYVLATPEQSASGRPILITQGDIRNVQLAKAALYAGIRVLMALAGIERVERVILAGAFGSMIDTQRAMMLGLIPDCDLNRVHSVGNAAGDGAVIALLNLARREEARHLAQRVSYVELSTEPAYQAAFVGALALPHASDLFPSLTGLLPTRQDSPAPPPAIRPRRRE